MGKRAVAVAGVLLLLGGLSCGDDSRSGTGLPDGGMVLIAPMSSGETLLIDQSGNTVHSWNSSYKPGLAAYLQQDGSIYRAGNMNNGAFGQAGGKGGIIERIKSDGTVEWSYVISSSTNLQHHDLEILPNGNLLVLVWTKIIGTAALAAGREPEKYDATNGLWSDEIWEIDPATDSVVWKWRVWDHLTTNSRGDYSKIYINTTGTGPDALYDWTHMNSIDYNSELDQIMVSVKNFNEVWIIDHSTTTAAAAGSAGDLLYRFGNPAAYGANGERLLYNQHDAEWMDNGTVMVFNNGLPSGSRNYSSVDLYELPVSGGVYTAGSEPQLTWSYSGNSLYSASVSGVAALGNGDLLITEGESGRLMAVDSAQDLLWEYTAPSALFKAEYYSNGFVTNL